MLLKSMMNNTMMNNKMKKGDEMNYKGFVVEYYGHKPVVTTEWYQVYLSAHNRAEELREQFLGIHGLTVTYSESEIMSTPTLRTLLNVDEKGDLIKDA